VAQFDAGDCLCRGPEVSPPPEEPFLREPLNGRPCHRPPRRVIRCDVQGVKGQSRLSTMPRRRRGSLATLRVVAALCGATDRRSYGLELTEVTGLRSGTLYPILDRLEHDGLIEAEWESVDRRDTVRAPRCYYHLTDQGLEVASGAADDLAGLASALRLGLV